MGRPRSADRSIEVKFLADLAQLKAGAKAAEQSLGGMSGKAFQLNNIVGALDTIWSVGKAAIGVWVSLARAASDYDQALGKVTAVFGGAGENIKAFAETSAEAWGQSRTDVANYAGDIGNVFTSMGIGEREAAAMSTSVLRLASDMSAFANLPISEALLAIRSGLVGETEPLRRFGILVYDAAIKSKALAEGIWDGKGAMNDQQKVMARFLLMQERGANMTGSFAREVDTLQVQSQKLGAELKNLTLTLGEGGISESAIGATKALRGLVIVAQDLAEGQYDDWSKEGGFLGIPYITQQGLFGWLSGTTILSGLGGALGDVADAADAAVAPMQGWAMAQASYITDVAAMQRAEAAVTAMLEKKRDAIQGEVDAFNAATQAQKDYLSGMAGLTSELNAAFDALDNPTLRETLNARWKDLAGKSFARAIKSGDPERKAAAQQAAMTFGRDLVAAGKAWVPTGNKIVDKWVEKGIREAKWKAQMEALLARMQSYLNRNPLSISVGDIMGIMNPQPNTPAPGTSSTNGQVAPTINITTGVGDPVAIGREVSRVLGAYTARTR